MAFKRLPKDDSPEDAPKARFRRLESSESEFKQSPIESVLSAGAKGLIKGGQEIARLHDPLSMIFGRKTDQPLQQVSEELLPSKAGFAENVAERTGRILPSLSLGGGSLLRSAIGALTGGAAGEVAKESGSGDIGQAIAEILGSGVTGLAKKGVSPLESQKKIYNLAKKYGLSEAEIAPAIQSEKKIRTLSKLAHRGQATTEKILKSRTAVGNIYEALKSQPNAKVPLSEEEIKPFLEDLHKELMKLPAKSRDHILRDFIDMTREGFSGEGRINFYQDINHYMSKGMKELGGVNKVVGQTLEKTFGEDFKLTNQLYKNVKKLGISVRPDLAEEFNNMRQGAEIAYGIVSGNPTILKAALGEITGRRLISNLLTNPRFQNLTKKLYEEVKNGKYSSAQKVLNLILEENEKE